MDESKPNDAGAADEEPVTLAIFKIVIKPNPELAGAAACTFVFKSAVCPSDLSFPSDWQNEFPRESGFFSAAWYLRVMSCEHLVSHIWGVDMHVIPSDFTSFVSYRDGVDSIWTGGAAFPTEEMNMLDRLQIPRAEWNEELKSTQHNIDASRIESSHTILPDSENVLRAPKKTRRSSRGDDIAATISTVDNKHKHLVQRLHKMLRKAFYRKSLQWHPDRWVAHPFYSDAVKRAFELVNDAYSGLSLEVNSLIEEEETKEEDIAVEPKEEEINSNSNNNNNEKDGAKSGTHHRGKQRK